MGTSSTPASKFIHPDSDVEQSAHSPHRHPSSSLCLLKSRSLAYSRRRILTTQCGDPRLYEKKSFMRIHPSIPTSLAGPLGNHYTRKLVRAPTAEMSCSGSVRSHGLTSHSTCINSHGHHSSPKYPATKAGHLEAKCRSTILTRYRSLHSQQYPNHSHYRHRGLASYRR
jgi:hypothetical protein